MRKVNSVLIAAFLLLAGASPLLAWPWNKDMFYHPAMRAREKAPTPVPGTFPLKGGERALSREEAAKVLKNPVPPTEKSLRRGKELFGVYCSICHGPDAKGRGPVTGKFIPAPDLTQDFFKKRPDGHIYGTIRNGGPVMPPYGETLSVEERWDVVNFLRKLQGK
ncbi:MAG: c-type cytochrome [Nitrospinota bacterium]